MSVCTNCNARLSCGCQKRVASNGVSCCSNCSANYEAGLKKPVVTTKLINKPTTPTGVKIAYKGPGRQNK